MFRCTKCNQLDNFSLMLSKNYTGPGKFSQKQNEHGEIIINIDGFEFIPDLAFMNTHAVCKYCGEINCFEYYFEHIEEKKQREKQTEKTTTEKKKRGSKPPEKQTDISINKRDEDQ